jgi:hypothetical protein
MNTTRPRPDSKSKSKPPLPPPAPNPDAGPVLIGACVDEALARVMSRRQGPAPVPRPAHPMRIEASAGTRRRTQRDTAVFGARF